MPTTSSTYDKPGDGWDQINTDDYFKDYFKTSNMGVLYNKKKINNNTTV